MYLLNQPPLGIRRDAAGKLYRVGLDHHSYIGLPCGLQKYLNWTTK
jgi:hypothetical protein